MSVNNDERSFYKPELFPERGKLILNKEAIMKDGQNWLSKIQISNDLKDNLILIIVFLFVLSPHLINIITLSLNANLMWNQRLVTYRHFNETDNTTRTIKKGSFDCVEILSEQLISPETEVPIFTMSCVAIIVQVLTKLVSTIISDFRIKFVSVNLQIVLGFWFTSTKIGDCDSIILDDRIEWLSGISLAFSVLSLPCLFTEVGACMWTISFVSMFVNFITRWAINGFDLACNLNKDNDFELLIFVSNIITLLMLPVEVLLIKKI